MNGFLLDFLDTVLYNNSFWSEYDVVFYTLIACSILFAIYVNYEELGKILRDNKEPLIIVLLLLTVLIGGFFRFSNMLFEYNSHDSTWEYINGARYFSETGKIFKCYGPSFYQCFGKTPVSHPGLLSFILGLFYSLLGYNLNATMILSVIVSTLTIPLAYYSVKTFLDSEKLGLMAAISLSIFPLHALYSGNLDFVLSVFSIFSIFFVILTTGLVIKKDTKESWILLMASYLFMVSFRWEHPIVIFFSLVLILSSQERPLDYVKEKISKKWFWFYGIIFSFLSIAPLKGIYSVWFRQESLGKSFTTAFFFESFSKAYSLLTRLYNLPGLLFILLIPFALKEDKKKSSIILVWWLTYIILYAFFRNGLTDRYVMNSLPPLILIGCIGLKNIFTNNNIIDKFSKERLLVIFSILMFLTIFISLPGQRPLISYDTYKRDDIGGFHDISEEIDKPLVVPNINTLLSLLTESEKTVYSFLTLTFFEEIDDLGEVYFIRTDGCEHEPGKEICEYMVGQGEKTDIKLNEWDVYLISMSSEEIEYMNERVTEDDF